MPENMKTPAIRYAGFTGAWEQRKLEELVSRVSARSDESYLPRVEYEDIVSGQGQLNNDIFEKKSCKTGIRFEPQDILFGKLRPYLHNWLLPDFTGIAVGDWWVLRPISTSHEFIYSLIQSNKYQYVSNLSTGTKMPRSDWSVVSKTEFSVPSDVDEQARIGSVFRNLDNLITLHQREYDKTVNIKKAMLEKMFPKDGADTPEIRFAGFTDAWEQRKLGNHAEILTGGTPRTSVMDYWEPKEIPWMSSGEVNKRRLGSTDNMISKEGFENSNARWVKEYSVLIALAGQGKTRGMVAINSKPLTTNQSIAAIVPDDTLHYEFIFQNLMSRYDELRMLSSGDGSRGGLNKQLVSDVCITCPDIAEQKSIGAIFANLDNLITLHQRELKRLQNMKKALLEKMFV